MTDGPNLVAAAASLFDAFVWDRVLPFASFALCMAVMFRMIAKAQKSDPTFKAADFLRDSDRKPSWSRLIGTLCFGVHSWYLFNAAVTKTATWNDVALYVVTWSASLTVLQGLAILRGVPPEVKRDPPQG